MQEVGRSIYLTVKEKYVWQQSNIIEYLYEGWNVMHISSK